MSKTGREGSARRAPDGTRRRNNQNQSRLCKTPYLLPQAHTRLCDAFFVASVGCTCPMRASLFRSMSHAGTNSQKYTHDPAPLRNHDIHGIHQWAEKYKANVFPRMTSSPARTPDLVKNSVPISSDRGFGRQGKSFPSGSSPTADRPSVVMTEPFSSMMIREGIPRTLNFVLSVDFLSLCWWCSGGGRRRKGKR